MSAQIKALRSLVALRRRQGERLATALTQARRQLAECEAREHAAQEDHAECVVNEAHANDDMDALMRKTFTPTALRALGFRIDDLKSATAMAHRKIAEQGQAVERQAQVVGAAQQAVSRNDQRISGFQEHLDHLLRLRDEAEQEREEEEVNETSTTRFVARQRVAKEAANG
jgi:chromosome segregation ATPase